MAAAKQREGKTPHGGVKSEAYYLDDDGKSVDEAIATRVEIVELDRDGNIIHRTYGEIKR